ncbi:hypothetical protein TNCT_606231 [Trichonephila clavata]|uniref:Uncharacterized protein n=1 Tax=Trichonephila clavata TaxID=2740835 RepID=A0A8X6FHM5_TRICU|nr:hypothetical protein TNCT_606231 [Trichonephila clavata]
MSSKIDSRSSDSKLWKLVKNTNKEKEQFSTCNSERDAAGQPTQITNQRPMASLHVINLQAGLTFPLSIDPS